MRWKREKEKVARSLQSSQEDAEMESDLVAAMETSLAAATEYEAPSRKLRIVIVTIGSRGDVQPYIALSQGLIRAGHNVTIATHEEFRGFVEGYGVTFNVLSGNPHELLELCVSNGMFTVDFVREARSKVGVALRMYEGAAWQ